MCGNGWGDREPKRLFRAPSGEIVAHEFDYSKTAVIYDENGVTNGSFYAHFRDRADFVAQFVEFWAEHFTQTVITAIDKLGDGPPGERLLALMQLLHREQSAAYDVAVRAWATHDPVVACGVAEVDKQRIEHIRGIFYDIGFRGADLDKRTRPFVVYHSMELGMRLPPSEFDAEEEVRRRHELLTRP